MPFLGVAVGFLRLRDRKDSVEDGAEFFLLAPFGEGLEVGEAYLDPVDFDLRAAPEGLKEHLKDRLDAWQGGDVASFRRQDRLAFLEGADGDGVEDDIVALVRLREIFPGVIDQPVGAERFDEIEILSARDPGHLRPVLFCDLNGEVADAAGGAVDQDPVARLDLAEVAERLQGGQARDRKGGGLFEGEVLRFQRGILFRDGGFFRAGPAGKGREEAEDVIADFEPRHRFPHLQDLAGEIRAGDPSLKAGDLRVAGAELPVDRVDSGGINFHQELALMDVGLRGEGRFQDIRRTIPVVDDGLHSSLSLA